MRTKIASFSCWIKTTLTVVNCAVKVDLLMRFSIFVEPGQLGHLTRWCAVMRKKLGFEFSIVVGLRRP